MANKHPFNESIIKKGMPGLHIWAILIESPYCKRPGRIFVSGTLAIGRILRYLEEYSHSSGLISKVGTQHAAEAELVPFSSNPCNVQVRKERISEVSREIILEGAVLWTVIPVNTEETQNKILWITCRLGLRLALQQDWNIIKTCAAH